MPIVKIYNALAITYDAQKITCNSQESFAIGNVRNVDLMLTCYLLAGLH